MAEEKKNMTTGNETPEKENGTPETPANDNKDEKEGVFKKVGGFFKKNGKKIGIGLGIAAAFAGGLVADKVGLPSFGKKNPDQTEDQEQ